MKWLNRQNRITRNLILCIVINLLPIAYTNINQPDQTQISVQLIILAFVVQAVILLITFRIRVALTLTRNKLFILAAALALTILAYAIINTSLVKINVLDYAYILIQGFNIVYLYLICSHYAISEDSLKSFMKSLAVIGIIACIYNLAVNFNEFQAITELTNSYQANFKSFFANRNQFAIFLAIVFIAVAYLQKSRNYRSFFIWVIQLFIFVNLFLTFSRTAIFATLLYAVMLTYTELKYKFVARYTVLVAGIILCLLLFNAPVFNETVTTLLVREESISTVSGRSEIWHSGLTVAAQTNPIFGIGYFSGIDIAKERGFPFTQFHSLYVDTLVTGGIVWLVIVIIILINTLKQVLSNLRKSQYYNIIKYSYLVFIVITIFESCGLFGIGYVDTIFTIFFISIPLLYSNHKSLIVK